MNWVASLAVFIAVWAIAALFLTPITLPSPWLTGKTAWEMILDGRLEQHMLVSYLRIFAGWTLGSIVGVMLGLLMGRIAAVRAFLGPTFEFARFIPPISFVTLFIIWLGVGEASRLMLIAYTTLFIVAVNVAAGVTAINEGYVRAARSMGASGSQVFVRVVVPRTVPYMITGMRLAMGNAFMTIVAAEILAAKSGLGYLIWNSQMFLQTAEVFVGFVALCVMGFTTDRLVQYLGRRFLSSYGVA